MSMGRALQDAAEPTERRIANEQIMIAQLRKYDAMKKEAAQKKEAENQKNRLETASVASVAIQKSWWQRCLTKVGYQR